MGEMADDLLDRIFGAQYEDEQDDFGRDPDNVTCRSCGVTGLKWYNVGTHHPQWRLYAGRGTRLVPHVCPTERRHQAVADDFEDES